MSWSVRLRLLAGAREFRCNFLSARDFPNYLEFTFAGAIVHCSRPQKRLKYAAERAQCAPTMRCGEREKCRNYSSGSQNRKLRSFGKRNEFSGVSSQKLKR